MTASTATVQDADERERFRQAIQESMDRRDQGGE